jgi:cell division protein FtsA
VQQEDVDQACSLAQGRELPENRTTIHHLRRPFRLDGRSVESPVGMEGERLEVSYWTMHGDSRKIGDAIHIINGFNLHVDDIVLAGLASSAAVATMDQKKNGVLVVDMGRGTTDYALFIDGRCMKAGCLPIGGDHISNDLSIGLRMRLKQAESLKLRYGSAIVEHKDKTEKVWLNNDFEIGDRPIPLWSIEKIIELRVSEIFEVVRKKLGAQYVPEKVSSGVIVSGGSSKLTNIDECAENVFGIQAQVGDNAAMASGELKDSQYSTALGLLHYGLQYQSEADYANHRQSSIFGRLKSLFQKA